jgi:hexosaminidase
LVARRFEADARAYAAGDRSGVDTLKSRLITWRANDAAFRAAAKGRAELESALPVSADIAELADVGLAAIEAREAGRPLDAAVRTRAETVLARWEAYEAASAKPLLSFLGKHPPADLIIKITPGVRVLVKAAP